MKRIFKTLATAMAVLAVASCTDEALTQRVENLEARMDAVEAQLKTDAGNIKTLLDAVNNGVTIQSVTPITEGFRVVFSNGKSFDITNGAKGDKGDTGATGATGAKGDKGDTGATGATGAKGDKGDTGAAGAAGKDGTSPVVTIEQGTDGNWYWVINGVNTGVKANGDKGDKGDKGDAGADGADGNDGAAGAAGAVPSFKIENGHVYYSFDGTTWEDAGELSSSSTCPIVDVNVDEENGVVTFTLAGGAEFVLSLDKQTFALIVPELNFVVSNGSVSIPYVLRGASSEAVVLAYFVGNVPAASIEVTDEAVEITATSSLESATLVIEAIDNALDSNNCAKKVIRFEDGVFVMEDSQKEFNVPAEGGTITFAFKSNLEIIVSTTDYEWIKPVSTKAVKEYTETYEVLANDSESPREGQLDILDFSQNPLATVTIHQEGKPAPKFTVEDFIGNYEGTSGMGLQIGETGTPGVNQQATTKFVIEASDNDSKGNLKFTTFDDVACAPAIYCTVDLTTGNISIPSGSVFQSEQGPAVSDRVVVLVYNEETKGYSCTAIVNQMAPGYFKGIVLNIVPAASEPEPGVTVDDFAGTYLGGMKEDMVYGGNVIVSENHLTEKVEFVFVAQQNADNNVVMTKFYGKDCNIPGVFNPETMTATFAEGNLTGVRANNLPIKTALVVVLSEDKQTLTQSGVCVIGTGAPDYNITLSDLAKKGEEAPAKFALTDVTDCDWVLTYSVDGSNWTDEDTFSFTALSAGAMAYYGANLYASGRGGQGKSFVINLDENTGAMTIPAEKVSGLVFSGIVEYDANNDRLRVPRDLKSDVVLQLSDDKTTISGASVELTGNATYGVGEKTLTNFKLTKK